MTATDLPMPERLIGAAGKALVPRPVRDYLRGHTESELPAARINPINAGKWWFDEASLQVEMASSRLRIPDGSFRSRIRSELTEARQLFEQEGWLADPRSYHQDPTPIERWTERPAGLGPFSYTHVRFDSEYEPHEGLPGRDRWLGYRPVKTGHAWMMRHEGEPRPWIVIVNGYRTGQVLVDLAAFRANWLHNELGLNVIAPVLPLHGPRAVGVGGARILHSGALNIVNTVSQGAWDVRRVIEYLRSEFDAPAVGLSGISLGGYLVGLVAGLHHDLAGVIAGVPESDLARALRRNLAPLLPPWYEQWGLSWEPLEQVLGAVSPLGLECQVPHERRYIYAGLLDRWVRPGNIKTLWDHWDQPSIHWYHGSHLSFPAEPGVQRYVERALREMYDLG